MAITEYNYIPTYIKRTIDNKPKDVITYSYWNELFNLLIKQGDHTAKELGNVLNHFTTAINEVKGITDGKYVKPTNGIPKTDLAAAVQTSLDKADTALQSVPSTYRTALAQDVIDSDLGNRIEVIEGKEAGWDGKQDKLIAGENITIAADGKTISAIVGSSASISMRVNGGYIQYSTDNGATWSNLIAEADLKGDSGADGTSLYTTTQDSALETTPFDIIYITTNDRTIVVGDLILTPAGRLYRVTSVSTSFVDAAYTTSLRGPQGVKGDKGDTGPKGEQGPSGVSPTISLEETASGVMIDIVNSDGTSSTSYVLHGQSAYEAARTGGYTDTQANFYTDLAATQGFASGLANKQDTIGDLETIRSGAAKGATALQVVPSTYRTALAQDVIDSDLGDRISAIEGKEAGWDAKSDFSGSYNDLTDKPTIPTEVTPLIGTTSVLTPTQVYDAVSAGIPVKVQHTDRTYGLLSFTAFNIAESMNMIVSQAIVYYNSVYILAELGGNIQAGNWFVQFTVLAEKKDIPTVPSTLPNPYALIIKIGSTTVTYDGSTAQTVTIDDGTEVSY